MPPGGRPYSDKSRPSPIRQLRVVVTPWASGLVTVDLISRRVIGGDKWDRRSGHLELRCAPTELEGLSAVDILRLLADRAERPAQAAPGTDPKPAVTPLEGCVDNPLV